MKKLNLNYYLYYIFRCYHYQPIQKLLIGKINFTKYATKQGVSDETLSSIIKNLKFLPKVIEYDRFQPEFYEDTSTYIGKEQQQKSGYWSTYI